MIHSNEEIKAALSASFEQMIRFQLALDKSSFEASPGGKWSAGQQLEHLIKSARPLNKVLRLPKFLLPMVFGKMNRSGRSFEELQIRYDQKLNAGGTASSPYLPPVVYFSERERKVKAFKKELQRLIRHVDRLSDKQLDTLILPHPLLGKLSLREMMFFTIFHTTHHLKILEGRTEYTR